MKFELITIFPDFFRGPLDYGIVRRARESGLVEINVHDLRTFTKDKHRTVDDRPFGGGEGMVLKPEPLFAAVESIWPERNPGRKVVLLSAQGRLPPGIVADHRVLGDRPHEVGDLVAEPPSQLGLVRVRVLEHVVQERGGDQALRAARLGELVHPLDHPALVAETEGASRCR